MVFIFSKSWRYYWRVTLLVKQLLNMMIDVKDKVVIITGSSSGIGQTIAVEYARHGAKVVVHGRRQQGIDDTVRLCEEAGAPKSKIAWFSLDLTEESDCNKLVDGTVEKFGQIDILVNNAGILLSQPFMKTTIQDFDKVMGTNIRPMWMVTQRAVPHLKKTKGCIVQVSSEAGMRPMWPIFAYSLSKAAMDHFTKMLALELASEGVRVTSVNPGPIDTPMLHGQEFSGGTEAGFQESSKKFANIRPIRRLGTTLEVANAVLFLTSPSAGFCTGTIFPIDGGYHVDTKLPE